MWALQKPYLSKYFLAGNGTYIPFEPQPDPDSILELRRHYASLKLDSTQPLSAYSRCATSVPCHHQFCNCHPENYRSPKQFSCKSITPNYNLNYHPESEASSKCSIFLVDLTLLSRDYELTKLIWSDILPRRYWSEAKGKQSEMEGLRRRLNRTVKKYI